MPVRTGQLVEALPQSARIIALHDAEVSSIAHDSREVTPGGLFVAIPGLQVDGHNYVESARALGARFFVLQQDRVDGADLLDKRWQDEPCSIVTVPDTREALAYLAAAFYGYPSRRLRVVGVTGTDGKTSTVFLTAAVLEAGGHATDFISTAAFKQGDDLVMNDTHLTSPDAIDVQRRMAEAVARGADCMVIECSSHGLDQRRLDAIDFDVAVFTNLADDHLDYHATREEYLEAKARLFDLLRRSEAGPHGRTAVVNATSPHASVLIERLGDAGRALRYGIDTPADLVAEEVRAESWLTDWRLHAPSGETDVRMSMPGRYNVENALAAAGAGVALGIEPLTIARGLSAFKGVPGRMERVHAGQPFEVVVDYAHTPQGLRAALSFLRAATEGRVIVVFGATGDRDRARRAGLAGAAAELADLAVVTTEDTWTEDPASIVQEVGAAFEALGVAEGERFVRIEDRREAIEHAIRIAQPGDTVLLAGVGPQQSIVQRGTLLPWDEAAVAREAIDGAALRADLPAV